MTHIERAALLAYEHYCLVVYAARPFTAWEALPAYVRWAWIGAIEKALGPNDCPMCKFKRNVEELEGKANQ